MPPERRRALVVGIDAYDGAPLAGCVNDATAVARLLRTHEDGSPNFDVRLVTADPQTVNRTTLRQRIAELFDGASDCDVALFYFSGHGSENNLGGYLITQDAQAYDEGVSLTDLLTAANRSSAKQRIVILDSCHSGHLGVVPASGSASVTLAEGVSVITAARSTEYAMESDGSGIFTSLLCAAWAGGASDVLGATSIAATYAYIEEALGSWDQRPMFRTNVASFVSLRQNSPAVPLDSLRSLPAWFASSSATMPLNPSFEPDSEPSNPTNERIFAQLQKCRAAKLVEPVGEDHMYYAAMHSQACRLTALGRHYWSLAESGRL